MALSNDSNTIMNLAVENNGYINYKQKILEIYIISSLILLS